MSPPPDAESVRKFFSKIQKGDRRARVRQLAQEIFVLGLEEINFLQPMNDGPTRKAARAAFVAAEIFEKEAESVERSEALQEGTPDKKEAPPPAQPIPDCCKRYGTDLHLCVNAPTAPVEENPPAEKPKQGMLRTGCILKTGGPEQLIEILPDGEKTPWFALVKENPGRAWRSGDRVIFRDPQIFALREVNGVRIETRAGFFTELTMM